jgi:uncharacterized protein YhaN
MTKVWLTLRCQQHGCHDKQLSQEVDTNFSKAMENGAAAIREQERADKAEANLRECKRELERLKTRLNELEKAANKLISDAKSDKYADCESCAKSCGLTDALAQNEIAPEGATEIMATLFLRKKGNLFIVTSPDHPSLYAANKDPAEATASILQSIEVLAIWRSFL